MVKRRKRQRRERVCDPSLCNHCKYIGDGDFTCDKFPDDDGDPITIVVSDWEPTEDYLRCQKEVHHDA